MSHAVGRSIPLCALAVSRPELAPIRGLASDRKTSASSICPSVLAPSYGEKGTGVVDSPRLLASLPPGERPSVPVSGLGFSARKRAWWYEATAQYGERLCHGTGAVTG